MRDCSQTWCEACTQYGVCEQDTPLEARIEQVREAIDMVRGITDDGAETPKGRGQAI